MEVQIAKVVQKPSGLWVITDTNGTRYATRSALKASIADRARIRGKAVIIGCGSGWFYENLHSIREVEAA